MASNITSQKAVAFIDSNDPNDMDEYGQVRPPSLATRCIKSPLSRKMKARKPHLPPRRKYRIDYRNLGKPKKRKEKRKKKEEEEKKEKEEEKDEKEEE